MPPKEGEVADIEDGAPRKFDRKSSLFADRDGCHLEFSNITLSTKTKNAKKDPPKEILKGLSGTFPPKTLTAIMGPSGSGKTSLLKVLTGRVGKSNLDLSGEIELDHKVVDPTNIDVRRSLAYVEQDVSIPPTCTPREAITFSARLRLDKSVSDEEIDTVVNDILDNLGLQGCADTLIGGGPLMSGGLSGGEKKRVQCGVELVTNPEIVLLDEPTSGLDSYSAQSLMDVLKKIADAGATVIVTIHQPPPPIVRKIDNTLLMLGGRIMYDGPMGDVLEAKFNESGFPKPDDYNIADWMLQVAQTNSMEDLDKAGFFEEAAKKSSGARASTKTASTSSPTEQVGIGIQIKLLFGREFKKIRRDKLSLVIRIVSSGVFGLLFGAIFYGVGNSDYFEFPEVMASFGAISNLLISTMFGVAQAALTSFPQDRAVFLREYSTNHYSVIPYFISRTLVECFETFIQVMSSLVVAFFLMGFQMNFFYFFALNFLLAIVCNSIGVFIGSSVSDPNVALEFIPALIVPQLLFSGFFIQTSLIPKLLRWAQYLCSLTYAVRLALVSEFGDCTTPSCLGLLENNGVNELESYWYWIILIAFIVVFRVTAMAVLRSKANF